LVRGNARKTIAAIRSSMDKEGKMPRKIIGLILTVGGGLLFLAAMIMGVVGIPRPGWGYYKMPMALIGIIVAAAGILLLEWNGKHKNDAPIRGKRFFLYGCILNLALSLFPRLPFINNISGWWRSSHTLLTSLWFQKEGINLFNYQTPIFGPPWKVPLEFPLYQAISTIFSNITRLNLTLSSRLMSLAIFYLSAVFLLLLCLEFIQSRSLCFIILTVYVWLPFNIRYSTEILPDFLSVALALSFLYWIKKWLESRRNFIFYFLGLLSGCLAAMAKITTMPIIIIPAVLLTLDGIQGWGINIKELFSPKTIFLQIKNHKSSLLLLAGLALLPLVSGILWVRFEDGIKQANMYTAWLTSANSGDWYVGTPGQNLSFTNWLGKFRNMYYNFFYGLIVLFPVLGIACLYKLPLKSRCVFGSALTSALLTIFIFFNLYLHEYYYIAVTASMCVLIGFGIYCLIRFLLQKNNWWYVFSGIGMIFLLMGSCEQYSFMRKTVNDEIKYEKSVILPVAEKVASITPENEYFISFQDDWYPDIMLYSQRKGLIITPREEKYFTCESIAHVPYTTIVVVKRPLDTPEKLGIFKCFISVELIEPGLYKVEPYS
jgi:hypothetical protein